MNRRLLYLRKDNDRCLFISRKWLRMGHSLLSQPILRYCWHCRERFYLLIKGRFALAHMKKPKVIGSQIYLFGIEMVFFDNYSWIYLNHKIDDKLFRFVVCTCKQATLHRFYKNRIIDLIWNFYNLYIKICYC